MDRFALFEIAFFLQAFQVSGGRKSDQRWKVAQTGSLFYFRGPALSTSPLKMDDDLRVRRDFYSLPCFYWGAKIQFF